MSAAALTYLPYHEPDITTILLLSSFVIALNATNSILDAILYCGLVGEVLVGIARGTPGAGWLSQVLENSIVQLGYLGLILLVFEGGLSTSFAALKQNLMISIVVAVTGVGLPIGLSYSLLCLANASPLQALAAGAALCSTSLGTTFTVLRTSGPNHTRMGTILSCAAMIDDIVGLVVVRVIRNFSSTEASIDALTVFRPIAVSIGFILAILLIARLCITPLRSYLQNYGPTAGSTRFSYRVSQRHETALILQTTLLLILVASASYAGASNLFAAYLAGASISWWFNQGEQKKTPSTSQIQLPGPKKA